jgi:hypothetical protein
VTSLTLVSGGVERVERRAVLYSDGAQMGGVRGRGVSDRRKTARHNGKKRTRVVRGSSISKSTRRRANDGPTHAQPTNTPWWRHAPLTDEEHDWERGTGWARAVSRVGWMLIVAFVGLSWPDTVGDVG